MTPDAAAPDRTLRIPLNESQDDKGRIDAYLTRSTDDIIPPVERDPIRRIAIKVDTH